MAAVPAIVRTHRALMVVLLAGLGLRIWLTLGYTPAITAYPDTWSYVVAAAGELFRDDAVRPMGYALLLRGVEAVGGSAATVVALQHLLGLLTAVALYWAVRRLGAPAWAAVIPAAGVALSLDLVAFEHQLLSETLFLALLAVAVAALAAALTARNSRHGLALLAVAGLAIGAATTVRTMGLFALPALVAGALAMTGAPVRLRLAAATVVVAAFAAPVLAYGAARAASGPGFGLAGGGGWAAYARAAPFADCREFTPPAGTEGLCESRSADARPGPDFYGWQTGSPGRTLFVGPPYNDATVGAWGRAAILATPRAYVREVARDLVRIVDPDAGRDRPHDGAGPESLALDIRYAGAEQLNRSVIEPYFGPYATRTAASVDELAALQGVLRIHGVLLVIAVGLATVALVRGRGAVRAMAGASAAAGLLLIVLPIATSVYNARYIAPAAPLLLVAGALGLAVATQRVSPGSPPGAPA